MSAYWSAIGWGLDLRQPPQSPNSADDEEVPVLTFVQRSAFAESMDPSMDSSAVSMIEERTLKIVMREIKTGR